MEKKNALTVVNILSTSDLNRAKAPAPGGACHWIERGNETSGIAKHDERFDQSSQKLSYFLPHSLTRFALRVAPPWSDGSHPTSTASRSASHSG